MQNEKVARRYATAIFSLAKDHGAVEGVGRDLRLVSETIAKDSDGRRFFVSPVINREIKGNAIRRTFEGRVTEVALNAVLLLVRKRREAILDAIVTEYERLAQAERGYAPLEVVSARPLADPELQELVARLSRAYNQRFDVMTRVDPALLGGVRVTMGDRRIDGTIAGRLDELARELATVK